MEGSTIEMSKWNTGDENEENCEEEYNDAGFDNNQPLEEPEKPGPSGCSPSIEVSIYQ